MGFEIAEGIARTMWAPLAGSTVAFADVPRLYIGELVVARYSGVQRLAYPYGWADKYHRDIQRSNLRSASSTGADNSIFGVVVGTNKKTPTFSSTYNAEYIAYADPATAGSEDYVGVGGPWAVGEKRAMVKIALVDATTILRAPVFSSTNTFGTAPSVLTATAVAGSTGLTTATCGFTPVAGFSTVYFRTGKNAGCYRICADASATVHTWREKTPSSGVVGDIIVKVHLPAIGKGRMTIPTRALWVNGISANSSNFFAIDVLRLDLSVAGKEYVDFRFNPTHFGTGNSPTT